MAILMFGGFLYTYIFGLVYFLEMFFKGSFSLHLFIKIQVCRQRNVILLTVSIT